MYRASLDLKENEIVAFVTDSSERQTAVFNDRYLSAVTSLSALVVNYGTTYFNFIYWRELQCTRRQFDFTVDMHGRPLCQKVV